MCVIRTLCGMILIFVGHIWASPVPEASWLAGSDGEGDFGPLDYRLSARSVVKATFPDADEISLASGVPPVATVHRDGDLIGYLFSTYETIDARGYAGEAFDIVAGVDLDGKVTGASLLSHNEPIVKSQGALEWGLQNYFSTLHNLNILRPVHNIGEGRLGGRAVDSVSGATISATLMYSAIILAARRVARERGLIENLEEAKIVLDLDTYEKTSWPSLRSEGSIQCRKFDPNNKAGVPTEICISLVTPAGIGRNLFGDKWYGYHLSQIGYGVQLLWIGSRGANSWKGALSDKIVSDSYVSGSKKPFQFSQLNPEVMLEKAVDKLEEETEETEETETVPSATDPTVEGPSIILKQGDFALSLGFGELIPPTAVRAMDAPKFDSVGLIKVKGGNKFQPYLPWHLELDFVGVDENETELINIDYQIPSKYVVGADFDLEESGLQPIKYVLGGLVRESKLTDWQRAWVGQAFNIFVLVMLLVVVSAVLVFKHVIVRRRQLYRWVRLSILVVVLVWLGWIAGAQLSIVNVFAYAQAIAGRLEWSTLLFEPLIVILVVYTALSLILLGRGVFCGWLCPFGAFQELLSQLARFARVPQLTPSFTLNEGLWAVKYLVVIGLAAVSVLWSMELGLLGAEVEPFKTAITLKFERPWPYAVYAILLLVVGLFMERFFCRFLCPLGGVLAFLGRFRLFQWLKRRPECGAPCHICEVSCPVQAIEPSGTINMNECFQCLDCQVDYYDDRRCPPLVFLRKKNEPTTIFFPNPLAAK